MTLGRGWGDCPWFGMEAEVGARVKVFRVHECPQRLGLITSMNGENGRIPFNYVDQMMLTWTNIWQIWRHIYWSAIPLNNSLFNPPPPLNIDNSIIIMFSLFRVLELCLPTGAWFNMYESLIWRNVRELAYRFSFSYFTMYLCKSDCLRM